MEREAPWSLQPGLTVMAKTYNGVVPGPTLVVNQGDRVVIELTNDLAIGDTLHLHGIHALTPQMDGVAGISQPLIAPHGGRYRYVITAARDGTFLYHSHDNEQTVNSGLYGGIIVVPAHPRPIERGIARDYLQILSSWQIRSTTENHFTINGKEYPATQPLEVARGERMRIRWINISGENDHTMHTHGHDEQVIARDARPVTYHDVEDTVMLGPGQRVDVVVTANAQPGTWLVHCHVLDHTEDSQGMPDGLVTAIHYRGTPDTLAAMNRAMRQMPVPTAGSGGRAIHALSFWTTVALGAFAGLTIFLGLPVARARRLSPHAISALNALAIGILVFLVVEIANNAIVPITRGVATWRSAGTPFPAGAAAALIAGLLLGFVGLGSVATQLTKRFGQQIAERPLALAMLIAVGIGAHNFAEGLAKSAPLRRAARSRSRSA